MRYQVQEHHKIELECMNDSPSFSPASFKLHHFTRHHDNCTESTCFSEDNKLKFSTTIIFFFKVNVSLKGKLHIIIINGKLVFFNIHKNECITSKRNGSFMYHLNQQLAICNLKPIQPTSPFFIYPEARNPFRF